MKLFYILFCLLISLSLKASEFADVLVIGEIKGLNYPFSEQQYFELSEEASTNELGESFSYRDQANGQNYTVYVCYVPCNDPEGTEEISGLGSFSGPSTGGVGGVGAAPGQGSHESDSDYAQRIRERQSLESELRSLKLQLSSLSSEVRNAENRINDAVNQRNQAATQRNSASRAAANAKAKEADAKEELEKNTKEKNRLEKKIIDSQETLENKKFNRNLLLQQNNSKLNLIENQSNTSINQAQSAETSIDNSVEQANSSTEEVINTSNLDSLEEESQIAAEERLAALLALETDYEFETPKTSEKYYNLHHIQKRIESTRALVATDQSENRPFRDALLDSAEFAVGVADSAYAEDDDSYGDFFLGFAIGAVDLATDFIPGVSAAKDAYKIWTGKDPITGEAISDVEIAMIAGGFFMPSILSGTVKGMVKLGKFVGKVAGKVGKAGKLAKKLKGSIKKSDDALADWFGRVPCFATNIWRSPIRWMKELIIPTAFACPPLGETSGELLESASKVPKVNGKTVRNYLFAGKNYSLDVNKNPILKQRIERIKDPIKRQIRQEKLAQLAKDFPDGVNFSKQGFPDLNPYVIKHKGMKVEVDIDFLKPGKGGRNADIRAANKKMKKLYRDWDMTDDATWHHVEHSTKLQLVPKDLHIAIGHTGGRDTYSF